MRKADEAFVHLRPLRWLQVLHALVPLQEAPSMEVRRVLVRHNPSEVPCAIHSS